MVPADWPADWNLESAAPLAEGVGGRVWRVGLRGGSAIVKRASAAARAEVASGGDYLRWRGGSGAARLLDRRSDLLLLEDAGTLSLREHGLAHGDRAAAGIAGDVIARLHAPAPEAAPRSLVPLKAHFASLFARAGRNSPGGIGGAHLEAAAALAGRLLDRQRDVKPLHGDIHHDNILAGQRGWLAIDPKGLIGDPAYDAANMFQNPVGAGAREDPLRIACMARIMAAATGRSRQAVLEYAFAYSGLSTSWWLDDGNHEAAASTVAIGRAIGGVLAQVRA